MKALPKTITVINSCQTLKQLKSANNMVINYSILHPNDGAIDKLNDLIYDRFKKIREVKKNGNN